MPAWWLGFFPCSHGVRLERLPFGFTDFRSRGEEAWGLQEKEQRTVFFFHVAGSGFWGACRGARGGVLVSYYYLR